MIGVKPGWFSAVKTGRIKGDAKLSEAAKILNVRPEWLIHGTGPAPEWPGTKIVHLAIVAGPDELPLLGTAAASVDPLTATLEERESFEVQIDAKLAYPWKKGRVVVQVLGESAYPVVYNGQFVICEPMRDLGNNDMVLLRLKNGRALVKRWCANGAPDGGTFVSVNGGRNSPWIPADKIESRWPIVGVLFE